MGVKVRRRAAGLYTVVAGRCMPLHGFVELRRLSAVNQWQGENYRNIATVQRSVASESISTSMIAAARQLAFNSPNVDFEINDILTMQYRQEFDLVASFNTLH
jgi:hypothetical protein